MGGLCFTSVLWVESNYINKEAPSTTAVVSQRACRLPPTSIDSLTTAFLRDTPSVQGNLLHNRRTHDGQTFNSLEFRKHSGRTATLISFKVLLTSHSPSYLLVLYSNIMCRGVTTCVSSPSYCTSIDNLTAVFLRETPFMQRNLLHNRRTHYGQTCDSLEFRKHSGRTATLQYVLMYQQVIFSKCFTSQSLVLACSKYYR